MLLMSLMTQLTPSAFAGDVWLVVDEPKHHLEVPTTWLLSDDEDTVLTTQKGPVDLGAEVAALEGSAIGKTRSWPMQTGTLTLVHRPVVESAIQDVVLNVGSGFTMSLSLSEDTAKLAASSIDADVAVEGLHIRIDEEDLLAPLRRAQPTVMYAGTNKKGKPVRVELK